MNPKDILKAAFSTPNDHYEYTRMPFDLKNAPPTFQRMKRLKELIGNNCFVYIDDIIVYGKPLKETIWKLLKNIRGYYLRLLFEKLRQVSKTSTGQM